MILHVNYTSIKRSYENTVEAVLYGRIKVKILEQSSLGKCHTVFMIKSNSGF